jgi:hypothetical protein
MIRKALPNSRPSSDWNSSWSPNSSEKLNASALKPSGRSAARTASAREVSTAVMASHCSVWLAPSGTIASVWRNTSTRPLSALGAPSSVASAGRSPVTRPAWSAGSSWSNPAKVSSTVASSMAVRSAPLSASACWTGVSQCTTAGRSGISER